MSGIFLSVGVLTHRNILIQKWHVNMNQGGQKLVVSTEGRHHGYHLNIHISKKTPA
jgi:hypothetical protein